MTYTLTYLSLGAGVQSTALLAMSCMGLYGCPRADVAIFADTQDEPRWVYDHLAVLVPWAAERGMRIDVVTRGRMSDQFDRKMRGVKGVRSAFIPAFTRGPDGKGILSRQCTNAYKIEPIEAHVRKLLGVAPHCRVQTKANPRQVLCLQGISLDEAHRAKDARTPWVTAEFPLLDACLTRDDCLRIIRECGLPVPRKSACVYCPFHGDAQWRELQEHDPEGFRKAIAVDLQIRDSSKAGLDRPIYLHASLKPLGEIDFTDYQGRLPFGEGWGNACGGECGV